MRDSEKLALHLANFAKRAEVRAWYQAKKAKDQDRGQGALIAVARKLALALYYVGARGAVFAACRLFPGTPTPSCPASPTAFDDAPQPPANLTPIPGLGRNVFWRVPKNARSRYGKSEPQLLSKSLLDTPTKGMAQMTKCTLIR